MKNLLDQQQLQRWDYFPASVFIIEAHEYLDSVTEVSEEYLNKKKAERKLDDIYPVYMTDNYFGDERIKEFQKFVGQSSWNILDSQGYAVDNYVTYFTEMWTQEHYKHSSMEQHIHGNGSQIVGFYFLDCPEDCSKLLIHDPKAAKVQIGLPQKNDTQITAASNMINFIPKKGQLIFTNSWLAHSFSRHASDQPMKFVHFNLNVQQMPEQPAPPPAEVI